MWWIYPIIALVIMYLIEVKLPSDEADDYMNAQHYAQIYKTDFATGAQINEAKKLNENLKKLNETNKK